MTKGAVCLLGVMLALGCGDDSETGDGSAGNAGEAAAAGSSGGGAGGAGQSGGTSVGAGSGGEAAGAGSGGNGGTGGNGGSAAPEDGGMTSDDAGSTPMATGIDCSPRSVEGDPGVRFHHVHFNTTDPDADIEFFDMFLGAPGVDFCNDENSVTRATQTERGYFLYTEVETPPDPALNTYLEHVGWINNDPVGELQRLVGLGVPLFPEGRAQCPEAAAGQAPCAPSSAPGFPYWFYLSAPSGARIEIAVGPGPATSGFGHLHMIMGVDFSFFETVTGGSFADGAIDMVNHTDVALQESILDNEMVTETRGKPIDHVGYSTVDLEGEHARLLAAGLTIEEDISFKPAYGFRSFFLKSPKGIWVEMVEDSPFGTQ